MSADRDETLRDEALSRLYRRSAAAEPPPALDALILAAARREAATRPARIHVAPWWRRWLAPMGVLATIVLTVSLTLTMERERRDLLPAPATVPAQVVAPAVPEVAPQSAQAVFPRLAGKPALPAEVKSGRQQGASPVQALAPEPAPAPAFVPPPVLAPQPAAEVRRDEMRAAEPPLLSRPAAAAGASSAESVRPRAFQAPASVGDRREHSMAKKALRPPEDWIEEIRRLRREGHDTEAQAQLEAFRLAYPGYRLPDDLKQD